MYTFFVIQTGAELIAETIMGILIIKLQLGPIPILPVHSSSLCTLQV